jgi:uncharacterized protein YbbK (DUF523 family)
MHQLEDLQRRLGDRRSRQVVFLAHCLLNENTRYLGGACHGGCVRSVVEPCVARDIGMVQLQCPEQEVWGGVLKRWLLQSYGMKGRWPYHWRHILVPLFLAYTRFRYQRIANRAADQIQDYIRSGFSVRAVVGIDGSPSCGVATTLDIHGAFERLAALDLASITPDTMTALVQASARSGRGLFIAALQQALRRRRLAVPFLAHDLIGELTGKTAPLDLSPAE